MVQVGSVIGGEGNGGVMLPDVRIYQIFYGYLPIEISVEMLLLLQLSLYNIWLTPLCQLAN